MKIIYKCKWTKGKIFVTHTRGRTQYRDVTLLKQINHQNTRGCTRSEPDPGLEVVVVGVAEPAAVPVAPQPQLVGGPAPRPELGQVGGDQVLHQLRGLVRHNPDRELTDHLQHSRRQRQH